MCMFLDKIKNATLDERITLESDIWESQKEK